MKTPAFTPTPRTDAAWAKTFQDDDDQCRAGNAASDMRDECATLEAELTALTTERDELRTDCENTTKWAAHYLAESIAVKHERNQLRAELVTAKKILNEETNRAERAEAELAAVKEGAK